MTRPIPPASRGVGAAAVETPDAAQLAAEMDGLLDEIATTLTGKPFVKGARERQARIHFARPITGAGFTYPWNEVRILYSADAWNTRDWRRETLAHELVHLVKYGATPINSVAQEYEAYRTAAQVQVEFKQMTPLEAARAYPDFFGLDPEHTSRAANLERLRKAFAYYAILPIEQPTKFAEKLVTLLAEAIWLMTQRRR